MIQEKLTADYASRGVSRLALMSFFPNDPDLRAALVEILTEMVETQEQCDWLVKQALKIYTRWPGIAELRALYCSRYRPKDGVEAYSEIYVGGFPHQTPPREFPKPQRGEPVTEDAELDREIRAAAAKKQFSDQKRGQ